jgi:hypothetical protein
MSKNLERNLIWWHAGHLNELRLSWHSAKEAENGFAVGNYLEDVVGSQVHGTHLSN